MLAEMILLRVLHVLGGIFWVGSGLFTAFFLMPSLIAAGPAAGAVMAGLQQRRLFVALPVVAVVTVLSGVRLLWIASVGFTPAYFASATGRTFAASGLAALLAFLLGMLVVRPNAARAATLGRGLASAPESERPALAEQVTRLQRRSASANLVVVTLLTLGAAGMAVARYLR